MINLTNLLALRNAIDDVLAGELPAAKTARKRLSKKDKMMEMHMQNFAAGTWKLPEEMKK